MGGEGPSAVCPVGTGSTGRAGAPGGVTQVEEASHATLPVRTP